MWITSTVQHLNALEPGSCLPLIEEASCPSSFGQRDVCFLRARAKSMSGQRQLLCGANSNALRRLHVGVACFGALAQRQSPPSRERSMFRSALEETLAERARRQSPSRSSSDGGFTCHTTEALHRAPAHRTPLPVPGGRRRRTRETAALQAQPLTCATRASAHSGLRWSVLCTGHGRTPLGANSWWRARVSAMSAVARKLDPTLRQKRWQR